MEVPYWLRDFHEETEAIRRRAAEIRQETELHRQQNASLRALRQQNASLRDLNQSPEKLKQIVQNSLKKSKTMVEDSKLNQVAQGLASINERMGKNTETLASNNEKLREMVTLLESCHLVSKEDVLDTLAAANYLGLTNPDTIRNWLEGGSFPGAFRSRGQWFFPLVSLIEVKNRMEEDRNVNLTESPKDCPNEESHPGVNRALQTSLEKLVMAVDIHMSGGFPIHRQLYQARCQAVDCLAKQSDGTLDQLGDGVPYRVPKLYDNQTR